MTPTKPHISEEVLAALIEGGLESVEAHSAKEHLTGCRVCMAAYVDGVHLRHHWRQRAAEPAPASKGSKYRNPSQAGLWFLAACIPLLMAAGAWFVLSGSDSDLGDLHPIFGQVAAEVELAAHRGMIPPGFGKSDWNPKPDQRGNYSTDFSDALDAIGDIPSGEIPYFAQNLRVAGLLAANRLDMARSLVTGELSSGSEDPDIQLLNAIVAYREGDLQTCEKYLGKSLETRPGHPETLFNLAMLLADTGQYDKARKIYEDLVLLEKYPLLHHRARIELSQLSD